MEFRFENPAALQLIWFVPLFLVLGIFLAKNHSHVIKKAIGEKLYPFLSSSLSVNRKKWKLILELFVLACFIFALARPQSGQSEQKVKSEGIELMLVFDVSNSMMAEDVKPSRLDLAKKEMIRFIDKKGGDRIGMLAFAGSAVLLSPMTTDRAAVKMYIESLSPETVYTQGTEFKEALTQARNSFKRGGVEEDEKTIVTRAIVIVSDGEDNAPGAMQVAEQLADEGVRIFTLGVGTEKGAPIPIRDRYGNLQGYRKDPSGNVVLSKTKGTVLKDIAKQGRGSFNHLTFAGRAIDNLIRDIDKLEKQEFESAEIVKYNERYQLILLFGILWALIELVLNERRPAGRIWKGRFEVKAQ